MMDSDTIKTIKEAHDLLVQARVKLESLMADGSGEAVEHTVEALYIHIEELAELIDQDDDDQY